MGLLNAQCALGASTGSVEALMQLAGALGDQPALATHAPWFSQWLSHPDRDGFWQDLSVAEHLDQVAVPALNVGGWFDIFAGATTSTFTRMRKEASSAEARKGQRLIMGPWDHLSYTGLYHDRQFGLSADMLAADLIGVHLQFFDRWVRGRTEAMEGASPGQIFVMAINQWRDEEDWPLPDTQYTDLFLGGSGRANTAEGDGVLTLGMPGPDASDTFTYDPADPVPSMGGRLIESTVLNAVGPVDQRPVERRDDILCFTTPPLDVTGHVSLVLHVASSAVDTDFTGKLVDVFPDGRAIYLTDGILRTRYRNSLSAPELLEPERVYQVTLDLSVTSNVFPPGHRIRLKVSSSNFPHYDRKLTPAAPSLRIPWTKRLWPLTGCCTAPNTRASWSCRSSIAERGGKTMATIFITGSNDGLGRDAAHRLVDDGHTVVGHTRSREKADRLQQELPGLSGVLVADLSSAGEVRRLADDANAFGTFDAVIQNAGVGYRERRRVETADGHAHLLAINVLAPYLLTAWMHRPGRIVYLTSGMQGGGSTDLSDLDWLSRPWDGVQAYSDAKLFDATLAAAIARRWPQVVSTSVSPGWVETKMGGASAPDDLDAASLTQAWLAVSDDEAALRSGAMFYHQEPILRTGGGGARALHPAVTTKAFQDDLLAALAALAGTELPTGDP